MPEVLDPTFLANRMLFVFRRDGAEGAKTSIFSCLPSDAREQIATRLTTRPDELAVLSCYLSPRSWATLTTERLAWVAADQYHQVDHAELVDVSVRLEDIQAAGEAGMAGVDSVWLETRGGLHVRIELEPGAPLLGFRSVLHWLIRKRWHDRLK